VVSRLPSRVGVGRMRPGDHACLMHASDEERAAVLSVFIADGLAGHQTVFLLSAEGTGPHEALAFLTEQGIDPSPYLLSGRLSVGGSGERSHTALPALVDAALRRGAPAVRICRDAPRSAPGALLPRAERELAALQRSRPVLLLCAYDEHTFARDELDAALEDHEWRAVPEPVYEDGLLRITRLFHPVALRLEGDVDSSNINGLARVLAAELRLLPSRDGSRGRAAVPVPMRLDLSALDFMDVGGMRLLVQMALTLHQGGEGRRLVLAGLAPHLRRVMRVVGWDNTPGLDLVPRFSRGDGDSREPPPDLGPSALSA
jgi:hypothetical protein